jgi:hypothetical protein
MILRSRFAAAVMACGLAACGGGNTPTPPAPTPPAVTPPVVTPPVATLPTGTISVFAGRLLADGGNSEGEVDGIGSAARFSMPGSLAFDQAGNLFVADKNNHAIRKISLSAQVSTVYKEAAFNPAELSVDAAGNVVVQDLFSISRLTPAGVKTTLWTGDFAYLPHGISVDQDGNFLTQLWDGRPGCYQPAPKAQPCDKVWLAKVTPAGSFAIVKEGKFPDEVSLLIDKSGNAYGFIDNTIRRTRPDGTVLVLAGAAGQPGVVDGTGAAARFKNVMLMIADANGNLFVHDDATIRKITPAGVVTTLAGSAGKYTVQLGPLPGSLGGVTGLAVDGAGELYCALGTENAILKIQFNK